ncbi:IS701 family transposase [Actinoplanes sp. NPDC051343]|uniref:IS701 family transposase n=1 Tax=Actinoplanes sp. NPDC051343 TaxID=3363906 RepID=UPI0037A7242A
MGRIAGRFARVETRRRARGLVLGLLADLPRKNCWTIAEHAGDSSPDGMQHLLNRASIDTDGLRDDLRDYVVEHLGDPDAVLVGDETGDVKKGVRTVGVQRQYTGTAGRVENAQVAVYLTYASRHGHALLDRELYLPKSWTGDRQRCEAAGVPAEVAFSTKPALATTMIGRALDAGVPASWVAADEVYGADPNLRGELEDRRIGYVLAIGCDRRITTATGTFRADQIPATLPEQAWQPLSCGPGAKGDRVYDWALLALNPPSATGGCRWLLIRRHRRHGELAFYRCYAPAPVPLRVLVAVAGRRWSVEESFQAGKGLAGLDEHQHRRWQPWHRWTIFAMLAYALLAVTTATAARTPAPAGLIALTCNEIRRLLVVHVIEPERRITDPDAWSTWRRRHQYRAKISHYQHQHP